MKTLLKIFLLTVSATLILTAACSDRGTNVDTDPPVFQEGGIARQEGAHVFFNELVLQLRNKFQLLGMAIYTPAVSFPPPSGTLEPVPTLVLLPPQDEDEYFFFNHGLKEIADELISNGTIQPMAIACIANDGLFGGYFYGGHSPAAGNYDILIGGTLIEHLHEFYPYTIDQTSKRAIGGVGQGAYGAFRAALLHPGTFSAVSAINGPLDFDGADDNSGFMDLFDDCLNEQGLLGQRLDDAFDSSGSWHLSRMFIGGALAFSPHDTAVTYTTFYNNNTNELIITVGTRYQLADSVTLITSIVNQDENNLDFHLPFDSTGAAHAPIWNMWLDNNLENLLNPTDDQLSGVNMWVASTPEEARFGFYDQTQSWISTLTGAPYNYPVVDTVFTGYEGNPADGQEYMYDLLRELLIFHSESFGD